MPETTQNPVSEADESVSYEPGSEEAAIAAFARQEGADAPEDEPEPADEAATEDEPEADEAEPEESEEADELVEVEIGEVTYKVPPEVQKAVLRQADYSRKMNEVGAQAKTLAERMEAVEALAQVAEMRAEALAEVRAIDARIKQYDGIDWAKARDENPAQAAMAAVELMSLRDQRKDAAQAAANVGRELTVGQNALLEQARADMDARLTKDMPGWGDKLGTELTRYALDAGVDLKTLQKITDPGLVIAMDKARKYDALQQAKVGLKAKAQTAPKVAKPGAPRRVDPAAEVIQRLRRDNTQESLEAAFLSRLG